MDNQNEVDHHLPLESRNISGSTEEIVVNFASKSEPLPMVPVDGQKGKMIDQQERNL